MRDITEIKKTGSERLKKKILSISICKVDAWVIKILVNATIYGIFIELIPEDKISDIQINGLDSFLVVTSKKSLYIRNVA